MKNEAEIRANAREAVKAKTGRVAPITELLQDHGWNGLWIWYHEFDLASGVPNPRLGYDDVTPTGH